MDKRNLSTNIGLLIFCLLGFAFFGIMCIFEKDTTTMENSDIVSNVQDENIIKENPEENEKVNDEVESVSVNEPEKIEENLTVDNCEDLANILKVGNGDELLKPFSEKYNNKIIEFDGNIAYMEKHGDYKTRYDILLYVGDYDENKASGPSFRLVDVNAHDLGTKEISMPFYVRMGSNIRATLKINGYNEQTGMILVKPVLIEPRENNN